MKQEWKNVFRHAWIVIVLIAIIAIPSIYACVFLGSMWDPYGNTGNIPVAVVNEDKEVIFHEKSLNVGKELSDNLSKNDSMDFKMVEANEANRGLENGDYYMIVTIPQDFSKHATTLLDDEPEKMIIQYTTNPGTNYIASKMDDSAIAKIKSEVSASVTKTYAKTIFEQIGVLSEGLNDASNGSEKLLNGVNQLSNGNQKISDNLKALASSSLTFKDGSQTLTNGLKDYTDGVIQIDHGVYSLKEGLTTLNQSTTPLQAGINRLNDGASSLNQGVQDYTNGVNTLYQGTQLLTSNHNQLLGGIKQVQAGLDELVKNNASLTEGSTQLSNGLIELNKAVSKDLSQGSKALSDGVDQLVNTLTGNTFQQSSQALIQGHNQAQDAFEKISIGKKQLDAIDYSQMNEEQLKAVLTQYKNLSDQYQALSENYETLASGGAMMANQLAGQKDQLLQLQQGAHAMNESVQGTLKTSVEQLMVGAQKLDQGLQAYTKGVSQLHVGVSDQENGLSQGLFQYIGGVDSLDKGASELQGHSAQLSEGAKALSDGTQQLNKQTPTLISGVQALYDGIGQVYDGTQKLVSNNPTLNQGAQKLRDGAGQISNGANQLAEGSNQLGDGLNEVKSGVDTLHTGLKDGADESKMSAQDKTYDMMASPVDTTHKEISVVENNGHAMAPYMMSVALYVAALAFTLMYPIRHGIENASSGWKYWLSKASVMYTISTIAAIALITCLRIFNGFEPQQLFMTYIFAIIVAAAFMSIAMLLSLTTGFIGEFLLLVFMVINLGGSAGTYPLETAGGFYKLIHSFVPYTYSVNGFRKTISMIGASISTEIFVFIAIIIICSLLTIVYYKYKNKEDKHIIPEAFEKVNE